MCMGLLRVPSWTWLVSDPSSSSWGTIWVLHNNILSDSGRCIGGSLRTMPSEDDPQMVSVLHSSSTQEDSVSTTTTMLYHAELGLHAKSSSRTIDSETRRIIIHLSDESHQRILRVDNESKMSYWRTILSSDDRIRIQNSSSWDVAWPHEAILVSMVEYRTSTNSAISTNSSQHHGMVHTIYNSNQQNTSE